MTDADTNGERRKESIAIAVLQTQVEQIHTNVEDLKNGQKDVFKILGAMSDKLQHTCDGCPPSQWTRYNAGQIKEIREDITTMHDDITTINGELGGFKRMTAGIATLISLILGGLGLLIGYHD